MPRERLVGGALILALIILVAVGLWQTAGQHAPGPTTVVRHPQGVMGTTCTLAVVAGHGGQERAEDALDEAEALLRAVETRMSTWLADSEISRFNAAGADEEVALSAESLEVLRAARKAAADTGGAFDVTCRPLIELWQRAGKRDRLPSEAELTAASAASSWELIELTEQGAVKRGGGARVDLGGIAKGYAIDRAAAALKRAGAPGGLVDIGGDLICFGQPTEGRHWTVDLQSPFGVGRLGQLQLPGGAVCTSGNYARFTVIEGKRYSHIIDPRTGRPADAVPSVTVVAPTAMTADIWATALSVLGPEGLARLPEGADALLILGSGDDCQMLCTAGFQELLREPLPDGLTVWQGG